MILCKAAWGLDVAAIAPLGYVRQTCLYHNREKVIMPPTGKLTLETIPVPVH